MGEEEGEGGEDEDGDIPNYLGRPGGNGGVERQMKEVLYIKVSRLPQLFFRAPLETRNRNTFHSTAVSWLTVTELDTNIGNYYGHFGVADTNLMVHKHVGMPAGGIREPPLCHRKWERVPQTALPEISDEI